METKKERLENDFKKPLRIERQLQAFWRNGAEQNKHNESLRSIYWHWNTQFVTELHERIKAGVYYVGGNGKRVT